MAGTGAEKHAPPVTNFAKFQLPLRPHPATRVASQGLCTWVKLSLQAGIADFAPIVLWSYSSSRKRLVLSMTKRVSALASERDKDFTRARVHAGVLYLEAERE